VCSRIPPSARQLHKLIKNNQPTIRINSIVAKVSQIHLYKRGRVWWYHYSLDGKRIQKSTRTTNKKTAQLVISNLAVKLDRVAAGLEKLDDFHQVNLKEFEKQMIQYIETRHNGRTPETYIQRLESFLAYLKENKIDLDSLDNTVVEGYINYRIGRVKNSTINNDLTMLKAVFYKAQRLKLIKANPFIGVRELPVIKKKPFFYTKEQIESIFKFIPERYKPHFIILLETGIRAGELALLHWSDIDYENHYLNITSRRSESKMRARSIPLSDNCIKAFKTRQQLNEHDTLIFSTKIGRPVHRNTLRNVWVRAKKKVNTRKGTVHDLRHTFASWFVQSGESLYELKELLGHSSIKVTEIYAHLIPKQEAYKKMNDIFDY